ncbi:SOS-response transcriptional repressor LexA [Sphingomonas endophytica]|uniref:SOS-response transcriptional repressor LexA n=2 Tax=Sphingomonas endophytica TaxID=869719 RepID=A0A7X0J9L1_9SPHN|nr:SOS-response transcriptional repressor LexA [Sphingomonas endophytica]
MGVPIALTAEAGRPASRRQEAFDFIRSYIVRHGHSPSIENIRLALGVSKTRAKALVHQLAAAKVIERVPGAQRGISIPGLARELVLEELRREGLVVSAGEPCPQGHLPLIAILAHVPVKSAGDQHDGSECGGVARL